MRSDDVSSPRYLCRMLLGGWLNHFHGADRSFAVKFSILVAIHGNCASPLGRLLFSLTTALTSTNNALRITDRVFFADIQFCTHLAQEALLYGTRGNLDRHSSTRLTSDRDASLSSVETHDLGHIGTIDIKLLFDLMLHNVRYMSVNFARKLNKIHQI